MKDNFVSYFIANRLSKEPSKGKDRIMSRVATLSVAVSIAVMIISLAVISGFKKEITAKVAGFNSHITISFLDNNRSLSSTPISRDQPFLQKVKMVDGVKNISGYSVKSGVMERNGVMEGVALKGVDRDFDDSFLRKNLVDGDIFDPTLEERKKSVVISMTLAKLLDVEVGDRVKMMFIEEPPRLDAFEVVGIYDTALSEFDRVMVYTDYRNVNRLYGWNEDQLSGIEITLDDIRDSEQMRAEIEDIMFYGDEDATLESLKTEDIRDKNGAIFDWLDLQDVNVAIITTIMLFVAGFNMISMMLILLLEKRSMIGVLKTLGMSDSALQKMFLIRASYISIRGIIYGVVVGCGLVLLQSYTGVVRLSASAYFMSEVPVELKFMTVVAVVVGALVSIVIIEIIPTFIITKLSPVESVKYE